MLRLIYFFGCLQELLCFSKIGLCAGENCNRKKVNALQNISDTSIKEVIVNMIQSFTWNNDSQMPLLLLWCNARMGKMHDIEGEVVTVPWVYCSIRLEFNYVLVNQSL